MNKIVRCDTESAGGDLLDFAGGAGCGVEIGIFAAFTSVAAAADLVHGQSESFVGFGA